MLQGMATKFLSVICKNLRSIFHCSTDAVTRMTEGLASMMLSLRRRFTIR